MYRKRRSRSRRRGHGFPQNRKAKTNYAPIVAILCLSVGCGYATAKYVVDPVVNYVPQPAAEQTQELTVASDGTAAQQSSAAAGGDAASENTKTPVVEDSVAVEEMGEIAGYALQFGCYSGKAAAETALPKIGVDGLEILEQNSMYKIIGKIYPTKEEAKAALQKLPEGVEAFVAAIYE